MVKVICKYSRSGLWSVCLLILFFGAAISGYVFNISGVSAAENDSKDIIPKVTVKPSLSVSLPEYGGEIDMDLDPATGDFDQQNLTITMSTNNPTGYTLRVDTVSNNTDLVNTTNPSYTIPNITSNVNAEDFPVNYWGIRLNTSGSSTSGDYTPFVHNAIVSQSDGPVSKATSAINFGAKVDYTKPAGLYQLKLNFSMIPIITQTYMQNLDSTVCKTTPTIVIDKRDEQSYLIQRLSDGKCWMLDNLNLDLTNVAVVDALNTANTNANGAALTSLKAGNRSAGDQYATAGLGFSNWTDTFDATRPLVNKSGSCSTASTYPCNYDGTYDNFSKLSNLTPNSAFGDDKHASGRVGIYYNYCAATAGSYCYDTSGTGAAPSNTDAQYDICPAGWKMPSANETQSLCDANNGSACNSDQTATNNENMKSEFAAAFSGFYAPNNGGGSRQGQYLRIWTSTWANSTIAVPYTFIVYDDYVVTHNNNANRELGVSVRCMLKE